MADNAAIKSDASATLFTTACDEVTYSGDTAKVQLMRLVGVTGSEGSKTVTEVMGTAGSAGAAVVTVQGVASMTPVQVGDNSGSLTVDAPVGTPVFVRLSDGSSAISTLPVSLASVPSHAVTNAGTFAVQNTPPAASTATLANVAASASSVTLQASNSSRLGWVVYNDSEATLYGKFGSTASTTSYTFKLGPFESYELQVTGCRYTGIVTGIWDSATGAARVTELTA